MAAAARVIWLGRPWVGVRVCHLLLLFLFFFSLVTCQVPSRGAYPGFQRIFFSDRYFAALTGRKAPRRKNNLWSQEHATSFPCEKSVQKLN